MNLSRRNISFNFWVIHQPVTAEDRVKKCGEVRPAQLGNSMKTHCRNIPPAPASFPPPHPSPSHSCILQSILPPLLWELLGLLTHTPAVPSSPHPYRHHQPPQEGGRSPEGWGCRASNAALCIVRLSNSREIPVHLSKAAPWLLCPAWLAQTLYVERQWGKEEAEGMTGTETRRLMQVLLLSWFYWQSIKFGWKIQR